MPLRELLRGQLMLALYRLGCRADALNIYRAGHRIMIAEVGLEPGPQLRSLHQRLLADDPTLLEPMGARRRAWCCALPSRRRSAMPASFSARRPGPAAERVAPGQVLRATPAQLARGRVSAPAPERH
jgi:DNA-binding SARP family transcriptional activator